MTRKAGHDWLPPAQSGNVIRSLLETPLNLFRFVFVVRQPGFGFRGFLRFRARDFASTGCAPQCLAIGDRPCNSLPVQVPK